MQIVSIFSIQLNHSLIFLFRLLSNKQLANDKNRYSLTHSHRKCEHTLNLSFALCKLDINWYLSIFLLGFSYSFVTIVEKNSLLEKLTPQSKKKSITWNSSQLHLRRSDTKVTKYFFLRTFLFMQNTRNYENQKLETLIHTATERRRFPNFMENNSSKNEKQKLYFVYTRKRNWITRLSRSNRTLNKWLELKLCLRYVYWKSNKKENTFKPRLHIYANKLYHCIWNSIYLKKKNVYENHTQTHTYTIPIELSSVLNRDWIVYIHVQLLYIVGCVCVFIYHSFYFHIPFRNFT